MFNSNPLTAVRSRELHDGTQDSPVVADLKCFLRRAANTRNIADTSMVMNEMGDTGQQEDVFMAYRCGRRHASHAW